MAVLAAALALASGSTAEAARPNPDSPTQALQFHLRGSNGYRLDVDWSSGFATISAQRGRRQGVAIYLVRGRRLSPTGFAARFPGLGRIAVRFQPRGRPAALPGFEGCREGTGTVRRGVFRGSIEFHGERDYTDMSANRVRGTQTSISRSACGAESDGADDQGESGGGGRSEFAITQLYAISPSGRVSFQTTRLRYGGADGPPPLISFSAMQSTRRGGMSILRMVGASGGRASFSGMHDGSSATAQARPPAPFSGAAEFSAMPDGTVSWRGRLSVSFPGTGPIRLAGKRFRSQLCVGQRCAGEDLGLGDNGYGYFDGRGGR